MLDDGFLEAGIDPIVGDARIGLLGLVEELYPRGVFRETHGGDDHGEDQLDRVSENPQGSTRSPSFSCSGSNTTCPAVNV